MTQQGATSSGHRRGIGSRGPQPASQPISSAIGLCVYATAAQLSASAVRSGNEHGRGVSTIASRATIKVGDTRPNWRASQRMQRCHRRRRPGNRVDCRSQHSIPQSRRTARPQESRPGDRPVRRRDSTRIQRPTARRIPRLVRPPMLPPPPDRLRDSHGHRPCPVAFGPVVTEKCENVGASLKEGTTAHRAGHRRSRHDLSVVADP